MYESIVNKTFRPNRYFKGTNKKIEELKIQVEKIVAGKSWVTEDGLLAGYWNKAKNKIKTESLALSSALANAISYGKLCKFLLDRGFDYKSGHW